MPAKAIQRIGIIGAGAWGTALANAAADSGREVVLWAREPEVVAAINGGHCNDIFLPGIPVRESVRATGAQAEACDADAILLVTPAQHVRKAGRDLAPHVSPGTPCVICAKGIEQGSNALLSTVLDEVMPEAPVAVLSGPTFAKEVARGLPTAVTLACRDEAVGTALIQALGSRTFRPYFSSDVVGAQIGGAVKNVLAIACGIVTGRALGENARASLITRGMAEILRLGRAMGAESATLMGLCGLGDLVLTCSSATSRNMSLGMALAGGAVAKDYLGAQKSVAEGAFSVGAVTALAQQHGIEMPIAASVDAIINHAASIDREIETLMSRPFTRELA